jgi:hypothetical protein
MNGSPAEILSRCLRLSRFLIVSLHDSGIAAL